MWKRVPPAVLPPYFLLLSWCGLVLLLALPLLLQLQLLLALPHVVVVAGVAVVVTATCSDCGCGCTLTVLLDASRERHILRTLSLAAQWGAKGAR